MAVVTAATTHSPSVKIRRLGIAVIAFLVLYSAGWYAVASKIDAYLSDFIATGPAHGVEARCDGLQTGGFPFLIGFSCKQAALTSTREAMAMSTGAIRAVARIYDPGTAVFEVEGPAGLTTPDGSQIIANWTSLRASARAGFSGLNRFSSVTEKLDATVLIADLDSGIKFRADEDEIHLRDNKGDLNVAALVRNIQWNVEGAAPVLPPLSASAEFTLEGQGALLKGKLRNGEPMAGQLTSFKIEMPNGIFGEMSGPFTIDEQGFVTGTFQTRLEHIALWEKTLLPAFPDAQGTVSGIAALLKGLAKGADNFNVKLEVNHGLITLSLFPIGHIPSIYGVED